MFCVVAVAFGLLLGVLMVIELTRDGGDDGPAPTTPSERRVSELEWEEKFRSSVQTGPQAAFDK